MALFGQQRGGMDWGRIGQFLLYGPEGAQERQDAERERRRAEEEQRRMTAIQDRLRAELSPADGPGGSGTGMAPSIQQQMAALENAQLLSPEAAAQFAPLVRQRQLNELSQNAPLNERLALLTNPEKAGESYASQFRDENLAAGSIRTRGGQTVAAAPTTQRFDDRFGTYDPMTGQTTYSQPRDPSFAEQTQRINTERPQIANLGVGQQSFGVDPYGNVSPLAQNTNAPPPSQAQQAFMREDEEAIQGLTTANERLGSVLNQLNNNELNLGPVTNMVSRGRNAAGASNQNSRNFASFESSLTSIVNESLRLNAGVQTEGDAQRAAAELMANRNDEGVVRQRLQELIGLNERAIDFRRNRMSPGQSQQQGYGQPSRSALEAEARRRGLIR